MLDKKSGMGLKNPATLANEKFLSLQRAGAEFIRAVKGERKFPTEDRLWAVK